MRTQSGAVSIPLLPRPLLIGTVLAPNRRTACISLRVPGRQAEPDFALYHQLSHRIVDRRIQDQPLRRSCTCNGRG